MKSFVPKFFAVLAAMSIAPNAKSNSPLLVDGAGRPIGFLYVGSYCNNSGDVGVISKTGYFACFLPSGKIDSALVPVGASGIVNGLYFESMDCTGAPLVISGGGSFTGGFIVETLRGLYTTAPGDQSSLMTLFSRADTGRACAGGASFATTVEALSATAGDSTTSGLSQVPYAAPFEIKILPDSALDDVIFFDGLDYQY